MVEIKSFLEIFFLKSAPNTPFFSFFKIDLRTFNSMERGILIKFIMLSIFSGFIRILYRGEPIYHNDDYDSRELSYTGSELVV